jgi:hypothetical protein
MSIEQEIRDIASYNGATECFLNNGEVKAILALIHRQRLEAQLNVLNEVAQQAHIEAKDAEQMALQPLTEPQFIMRQLYDRLATLEAELKEEE